MTSTASGQGVNIDQPQTILDLSKSFDGLPKGGLSALLFIRKQAATVEGAEEGHIDKKLALASKDGSVPILSNTPHGLVPAAPTTSAAGQAVKPEFIRPAVANPSLILSQLRLAVPKVRPHVVLYET